MGVDGRKHTDLLDGDNLLIFPCLFFPFLLFKAVLAVVHDPAHRRLCTRCDLYQIQVFFIGDLLRISCRLCSEFFAVLVDDQNLSVPNFLIDLQFLFADKPAPPNILFSNKKKRPLFQVNTPSPFVKTVLSPERKAVVHEY